MFTLQLAWVGAKWSHESRSSFWISSPFKLTRSHVQGVLFTKSQGKQSPWTSSAHYRCKLCTIDNRLINIL